MMLCTELVRSLIDLAYAVKVERLDEESVFVGASHIQWLADTLLDRRYAGPPITRIYTRGDQICAGIAQVMIDGNQYCAQHGLVKLGELRLK